MVLNVLSGFEEFQNTKEGKKVQGIQRSRNDEPLLKFRKVVLKNGHIDINVVFNRPLLRQMKDSNMFTFKLLFNETNNNIAIKYDTSTSAKTLVNRCTRENGDIVITDKFITATMLPLMKNVKGLDYKIRNIIDKTIIILNK